MTIRPRTALAAVALATTASLSLLPTASAGTPADAPKPLTWYRQSSEVYGRILPRTSGVADQRCPGGSLVTGGGVMNHSTDLAASLAESFPALGPAGWSITYRNGGDDTTRMGRVWSICVRGVARYSVTSGKNAPAAGSSQTTAEVACPTGLVPLGGGGTLGARDTMSLNSSYPTAGGWRVTVDNHATADSSVTPVAVCATAPAGYEQVASTPTTVEASQQGSAVAACPPGKVVLGGGAQSDATSTSVGVNSTAPIGPHHWTVSENNGSAQASTVLAWAVCARADGS